MLTGSQILFLGMRLICIICIFAAWEDRGQFLGSSFSCYHGREQPGAPPDPRLGYPNTASALCKQSCWQPQRHPQLSHLQTTLPWAWSTEITPHGNPMEIPHISSFLQNCFNDEIISGQSLGQCVARSCFFPLVMQPAFLAVTSTYKRIADRPISQPTPYVSLLCQR